MPEKLAFLVDSLPEFISEPIKFLSVITSAGDDSKYLEQNLRHSHVYEGSGITNVLEIIDFVSPIKKTSQSSQIPYYSLEVSSGDNLLKLDSKTLGSVTLSLDEHTYNHHSYVGRYIKFKKSIPAKGSPQFTTRYQASIEWKSDSKYVKDLRALVSEVFVNAHVVLLSNFSSSVPNSLLVDTHKKAKVQRMPLFLPAEFETSQSLAESIEPPSGEDVHELYEFLSVLHLNSLPDYRDSHVRATSTYEIPEPALQLNLPLKSSLHISVKDVNPAVFYDSVRNSKCLSVQATTNKASYLVLNLGSTVWTWIIKR